MRLRFFHLVLLLDTIAHKVMDLIGERMPRGKDFNKLIDS